MDEKLPKLIQEIVDLEKAHQENENSVTGEQFLHKFIKNREKNHFISITVIFILRTDQT